MCIESIRSCRRCILSRNSQSKRGVLSVFLHKIQRSNHIKPPEEKRGVDKPKYAYLGAWIRGQLVCEALLFFRSLPCWLKNGIWLFDATDNDLTDHGSSVILSCLYFVSYPNHSLAWATIYYKVLNTACVAFLILFTLELKQENYHTNEKLGRSFKTRNTVANRRRN